MSSSQKIRRIFHTWDKWECYPAGFYENTSKKMTKEQGENLYLEFLSDLKRFERALHRVVTEWVFSCQHYLTNEKMNRIAWLGQASACIDMGVPSCCRSGYFKLTAEQQSLADDMALKWLNMWLVWNGYEEVDLIGAGVKSHANIY